MTRPTLLDALDLRGTSWMADAVCATVDGDAWFPELGENGRAAKRICAGCPVADACLAYALPIEGLAGIWGGMSERERMVERRRRGLSLLKPCGTRAAYERHKKAGEPPCEACLAGKADYQRTYDARRRVSRGAA